MNREEKTPKELQQSKKAGIFPRRNLMLGAAGVAAGIGTTVAGMRAISAQDELDPATKAFGDKCARTKILLTDATVGEMLSSASTVPFATILKRHVADLPDQSDQDLIRELVKALEDSGREILYRDFFALTEAYWEPDEPKRKNIKYYCNYAINRFQFTAPKHFVPPGGSENPASRTRSKKILDGWPETVDGMDYNVQGLVAAMGADTPYFNLFSGQPSSTATPPIWRRHLRDLGLRHNLIGPVEMLDSKEQYDAMVYGKLEDNEDDKGCAFYDGTKWVCQTHESLSCDVGTGEDPGNSGLCEP